MDFDEPEINDGLDRDDSTLDDSWRSIRPDNIASDKDKDRQAQRTAARRSGRDTENAAGGVIPSSGGLGGRSEARAAERVGGASGAGFKNSVAGRGSNQTGKVDLTKGGMIKGLMQKGPGFLIVLALCGAGFMILSSQIVAPFALIANGLDEFNAVRTSMNYRSNPFTKMMLTVNRATKHPISDDAPSVYKKEKFTITKFLQKKFRGQGITYHSEDETGTRFLEYDDSVTRSKLAVGGFSDEGLPDEINGITTRKLDLDDALTLSYEFDTKESSGTRTIKGHFAGWWDTVSEKFHMRISALRNRFRGLSKTADDDDIVDAATKKGLAAEVPGSEGNVKEKGWNSVCFPDKDGNCTGVYHSTYYGESDAGIGDDALTEGMDSNAVSNALTNRAKKAAASMNALINPLAMACGFYKAISVVEGAMMALQVARIINYVTTVTETIQMTQVGDAGQEMAYFMNGLSTKGNTTGLTANGTWDEHYREDTAAMESPAFNHFFGGTPVENDDPIARKFNVGNTMQLTISKLKSGLNSDKKYWKENDPSYENRWSDNSSPVSGNAEFTLQEGINKLGGPVAAFQACLGVSILGNLADIVTAVATFGVGTILSGLIDRLVMAAIGAAIGVIISAMVPRVVELLAVNLIKNMSGEDAAYALDSGFNMYLGRQMESGSGKPGSKDEVVAMHRQTQKVIASEAEYERRTRSPFDITSKNTFLGSIMYALIPIGISLRLGTSPMSVASQMATVTSNSAIALNPTASAIDDGAKFEQSLNEECPALNQMGGVGDSYCNPYFVSSYVVDDDAEVDPYDTFMEICEDNFKNGCEGSGGGDKEDEDTDYGDNPEIKEGSELAKWVVACAVRESQFGYTDSRVANYVVDGDSSMKQAVGTGVSLIPILGDAFDLMKAAGQAANIDWITGKACMSEESKNYSRFSEDQRMMETAGMVKESAVTAFLDDYYEKYPLDNSFEGVIARYSGMTDDDVELALGTIEYLAFLDGYAPEELGPLVPAPKTTANKTWHVETNDATEGISQLEVKLTERVVYDDLRGRVRLV